MLELTDVIKGRTLGRVRTTTLKKREKKSHPRGADGKK